MAKARKCDWCGIYYTENSKEEENRPVLGKESNNVFFPKKEIPFDYLIMTSGPRDSHTFIRKDLCGRCAKFIFEKLGGVPEKD